MFCISFLIGPTLNSSDRIDLLLTDVVLPGGRSGPEIARQAARNRPALKVLFTSGYTKDELGEADGLRHKDKLIAKPCAELPRRISELFDAEASSGKQAEDALL